jgi:predicted XRE-type DNA-binding protein
MQNTKQHLINSIRHAMFDQKVTQVELAKRVGISATRLRYILKNEAGLDKLVVILDKLGYTVNFEVKYTGD